MVLFLRQSCHGNQTSPVSISVIHPVFHFINIKVFVHTSTANCILFAVCYVIMEHPNKQFAEVNMLTCSSQGTVETDRSVTCRLHLFFPLFGSLHEHFIK